MTRPRLFDERGEWTPEGLEATNMINPIIERLFDEVFKAYGFNPREIGQMIASEADISATTRVLFAQAETAMAKRRKSRPPTVIYLSGPVS